MKLALAQQAAVADRVRNLELALENMAKAKRAGAGAIVFPELATERFFPQFPRRDEFLSLAEPIPGPTSDRVAAAARDLALVTIFNMYEIDDRGLRFDASPVFDADGRMLGVTRMVHIAEFEGFHEKGYYHPGDRGAPVYETRVGRVGVAICYDRHFPEYMRALGAGGAQIVAIPQAGALDEWPDGLFEAEVRTSAFQNGYFVGLANRVGREEKLTFAGESFVCDPQGQIVARGRRLQEDLVVADIDPGSAAGSTSRRLFWRDRRPELYPGWLEG